MFNECYFQARWHCACDWDVLHSCCYCRCCGFEGKVHKKWNSHENTRKNSTPQIYYIMHKSNPITLDEAPYLTGSEQLFGPRRLKLRWRVRRRICQNQLIQGWSASSRWTSSTQSPWTSPPLLRFPKRWAFSLSLVWHFTSPGERRQEVCWLWLHPLQWPRSLSASSSISGKCKLNPDGR